MSATDTTNGTITLKSFAELGTAFPPDTLPDGPAETNRVELNDQPAAQPRPKADLAEVIARLASVNGGLESIARDDARAREQATVELARYEALTAQRQAAEHALAEAQRVRAAAEQLAAEAFSKDARIQAAQHVADARAAELCCTELVAEYARAIDELAGRPHLARILAARERLAQEQRDAARRAEAERDQRLARGLDAVDGALRRDELDNAQKLIEPLAREFPDNSDVRRKLDTVRWRLRNRLVAPAEAALSDIARRPYRDDPEATVVRLAEVDTRGLPEELARRVFGLWSNACWRVVQLRGWEDPRRESPGISRGAVWARRPDGMYEVVSSLSHPAFQASTTVPADIARSAQPLLPGARRRDSASAAS
jgi:hypothetical protein